MEHMAEFQGLAPNHRPTHLSLSFSHPSCEQHSSRRWWIYPHRVMIRLLRVLLRSAAAALKTRRHLALENLALRQQLSVLLTTGHRRPSLTDFDRTFWTMLRRRWSGWKRALVIVQPETVVRWHRQGFKYLSLVKTSSVLRFIGLLACIPVAEDFPSPGKSHQFPDG